MKLVLKGVNISYESIELDIGITEMVKIFADSDARKAFYRLKETIVRQTKSDNNFDIENVDVENVDVPKAEADKLDKEDSWM